MNRFDAVIIQESFLLTSLQNKSAEKMIYNDYIEIFLAFKKIVSIDVEFIVQVFPEYTPHNEEYHLRRLLFLAEEILGRELINSLNATELLVLCLAIFGHDWGMAVSDVEKGVISDTAIKENHDFALVKSDQARFSKHLKRFGESAENISQFTWQEYIRSTHAERSAERVRKYFKTIDNGIGEATARICLGHWLDFKDVRDQTMYPLRYIVKGESVNLRAITIYLRLIDLFDITNERTPYTIYKYTAPLSSRSKMEWKKHYSINSLATVQFQGGRLIQVDGQTDDYKVYAELEDLRDFCKEQLIGCNDLLQDVPDERYYINIFDIKWNINPLGFDPISIKFQFDRKKMFDVLSEEIYKGDRYVFIRELLQNSIDAIRFRKEWIEKNTGALMPNFGKIMIEVSDSGDDIMTFSITDDGIGMDLYIIENYLSIAGKSYYSSDEFMRLGIEMDPISKFGVGILSCFMVADRIQIITFKDPQIKKNSKVIKIDIPYVDQQFRISATERDDEQVGTTVKVYISKEKITNQIGEDSEISVSSYLKNLTGYIDFPILIKENGTNTVIVDPRKEDFDFPDFEIYKLDTTIDFNKVFLPQSLKLAKEHFTIKKFSIHEDLKMNGIFGEIGYVVPKNPFLKITSDYRSRTRPEYLLTFPGKRAQDRSIKLKPEWYEYKFANVDKDYRYGASSYSTEPFKVYLDGILIPRAVPPSNIEGLSYEGQSLNYFPDYFSMERFVIPSVHIQFSKSQVRQIDLSRTEIMQDGFFWDELLSTNLHQHIIEVHGTSLLDPDLKRRIMYIIYLIYFYRVPLSFILKYIGYENAPLLIIDKDGNFEFDIWKNYIGKTVYFQPSYTSWFREGVLKMLDERHDLDDSLLYWKGDGFIIGDISHPELNLKHGSAQAVAASTLAQSYITESHVFSSYRFLESPWLEGPPLIQAVWNPQLQTFLVEDVNIVSKAAENIDSIEDESFSYLLEKIREYLDEYIDIYPQVGPFQSPYESSFAYGVGILNLNCKFTKGLIRILANIAIYEQSKSIESPEWAQMIDKVLELPFFDHNTYFYHEFSIDETNLIIDEVNNMITTSLLIKNYEKLKHISLESFVEHTLFKATDGNYYQFFNNADKNDYYFNPKYSITL